MENPALGKSDGSDLEKMGSKLKKFVNRINRLIDGYRSRNFVRDRIDEFYYMQKREELKVLFGQIEETQKQLGVLNERYDAKYKKLFMQWQQDARWLERNKAADSSSAAAGSNSTIEVDLTRITKVSKKPF
jgi:hypothetical protein